MRSSRERASIIDISNFAKYRVQGPGAKGWLDGLFPNRIPDVPGRSCLTPLIGKRGGIAGDFMVICMRADDYPMVGSGMAERYHQRFFGAHPLPEGTSFHSLTEA